MNIRMCSFDLENVYINIPMPDIINMSENIIENNSEIITANQKEIINLLKKLMEQSYFQCHQQYYKQIEGLVMGALTSTLLAELYIQYMEHKQLCSILLKHQTTGYFRYVENILIICDQKETSIDETVAEFNKEPL
jgi:hypothetical protein